jgi:RHS repeat-associated protein
VGSAFDAAGRRTALTYPGTGLTLNMDYLVTGETQKIRENNATTGAGVLATYAYDDLGRRTSLTRGNGTVTSYAYDNVSRLASLTQDLSGTANDLTHSFAYNPADEIASLTRSNDLYAFPAIASGSTAYAANGLNQMTSAGGASLTFDARGNMTASGSDTYGYSSENLLTSATVGGVSSTLSYDPKLRLYQLTTGASTTKAAYDGVERIAEYDGSNALLRRYVFGPGEDEPILQYEGSGLTDRRYLHADERSSIVATTDAAGALLGIDSYDEYGLPAATNIGRFQYTGQAWLPEVGLYDYKARMYDPARGAFEQTDPTGYDDGPNWYAYTGGDPINGSDPSGTDSSFELGATQLAQQYANGEISKDRYEELINAQIQGGLIGLVVLPVEGLAMEGIAGLGRVLGLAGRGASVERAVIAARAVETQKYQNALKAAEGVYRSGGTKGLEKAAQSYRRQLERHAEKIIEAKEKGGYTSSMDREMKAFERNLNAVEELIERIKIKF